MKQSRKASAAESAINIGAGFGISFAAQLVFLPMLGVPINLSQNFAFACIMTVISFARQFALRRVFEWLQIRVPMSPFVLAVIAERARQISAEGWTPEHDDKYLRGELAQAGACYALADQQLVADVLPRLWRWDADWWKPADFRRNQVKAAALIIAEGERFDRQKTRKPARLKEAA